jgi:adenylate kinase
MRLLIMGAPGSGKGTQGKRLAAHLGIPAISTGTILREHVAKETPLGIQIKHDMDNGDYVADPVVEQIVRERLAQEDARMGFLLDGFPRTVHQAQTLDAILGESHLALDHVISLTTEGDALVSRMLQRAEIEGRPDDNEETIRHRMNVYAEETEPVLDFYRERDIVIEIDGDGDIDEVQATIRRELLDEYDDGA